MRSAIVAALLLVASPASAQNIWQINQAYQNQINSAYYYQRPYYAPVYYAPAYYAPSYGSYYSRPSYVTTYQLEEQNYQLRRLNNTLQDIEFNQRWAR